MHYIDPHGPYRAPDPPRRFAHEAPVEIDTSRLSGTVRVEGIDDGLEYVDRYDEEIAYTDEQIGRFLDGYVERGGDLDRALVVFTADHGESMMEHELWFAHGHHVYDEVVRVPLMLRGPEVPVGRLSGPTSGIDIAPTILAFAGAERPAGVGGLDLRDVEAIGDDRRVYSEATSPLAVWAGGDEPVVGYWRAVWQDQRKWMLGLVRGERDVVERRRYDLVRDPGEESPETTEPVAAAEDALRRLIEADPDPGGVPAELRRGIALDAPKVDPRASDEQREQLRALGYVE